MQIDIPGNISLIRQRIASAAKKAGRDPSAITLIAVSKTVGADAVREAIRCGITVFGESRIQEALGKQREIKEPVEWHFIGPLQKNKAKFIPGNFSLVHSVDSFPLAEEIARRARAAGKTVPVLLEINIAGEESKMGVPPALAPDTVRRIAGLEGVRLKGLMAIPPETEDPERSRPYFREMTGIKKELSLLGLENADFDILSFGMTGDFEVAVEEGATHVRIGRGVFGER